MCLSDFRMGPKEPTYNYLRQKLGEIKMPHDANGRLVEVGQRVAVEFEVREVNSSPDYCNCTLVIPGEHGPDNVVSTLVVNTKQVVIK